MFKLWSEWDIGEGRVVFASKEAGIAWLRDNPHILEMAADENIKIDPYIEHLFDIDLFCWETVEIIK